VNRKEINKALKAISGARVVVLGDLCLDENVVGRGDAVAKEAPVIALTGERRVFAPGQASNVAANCAALGAETHVVGTVGADDAGERLVSILTDLGVNTDGVVIDPDGPTIHKVKIVGREPQRHDQHLLHIYWHSGELPNAAVLGEVYRRYAEIVGGSGAAILSDYGYGIVSEPDDVKRAAELARGAGTRSVLNARGALPRGAGPDAAVANAEEIAGVVPSAADGTDELIAAIPEAAAAVGCGSMLVTVGNGGMYAWPLDGAVAHYPALAATVADVTGAGDTVTAAAGCALAAGLKLRAAAELANIAAAVVVGKEGTSTAGAGEVLEFIKSLTGR
jgi:rfaE bifunctional protein kinase chain/domain